MRASPPLGPASPHACPCVLMRAAPYSLTRGESKKNPLQTPHPAGLLFMASSFSPAERAASLVHHAHHLVHRRDRRPPSHRVQRLE
eukprot:3654123-Prymnesium_polylepis.1